MAKFTRVGLFVVTPAALVLFLLFIWLNLPSPAKTMRVLSFFDEDEQCEGAIRIYAMITKKDMDEEREYDSKPKVSDALSNYLKKFKPLYTCQVTLPPKDSDEEKENEGGGGGGNQKSEATKKKQKEKQPKTVDVVSETYATAILYKETQNNAIAIHGVKDMDNFGKEIFDAFNVFPTDEKQSVMIEIRICYGLKHPTEYMARMVTNLLRDNRIKERKDKFLKLYKKTTDYFSFIEM